MIETGTDPAGLGRGRLTRRFPVLWQAPKDAPQAVPFVVTPETTSRGFLWRVLLSAKRHTVPGALASIVEHVGTALVPVIIGLAIDQAVATGDRSRLLSWLGVLVLVGSARVVAARMSQQLGIFASQLAQHRLRASLSRAALHPSGAAAKQPDGTVVSIMTNDVSRLGSLGLLVHPVGEVATIAFIAVCLIVIAWPVGLAVLIGAPLVVWLMGRLSGRYARANRRHQGQLAATVAQASDLVTGYRVIKGVQAEAEATARYEAASRTTLAGALRTADVLGWFLAGSGAVSGVFVVGVAAYAGWFAVHDQLTVGELISAVGLAQALLPMMQFVTGNAVPAAAAASASAARILAVLQAVSPAPRPRPAADAGSAGVATVELVLDDREPVEIAPGELLGVRADGRTAARLVDAAINPHAPDGIRLRLDGTPAESIAAARYRAQVTVSPHHAMLFSGSVIDNLVHPGAADRVTTEALRAAACEEFVDVESGGSETVVGEMGNRLSGGQRQRVALARALATDAPVLVLHDPTTAVDPVTEQLIAARLRELRRGRSTLLIVSSPALLAVCDRVVDLTADLATDLERAW